MRVDGGIVGRDIVAEMRDVAVSEAGLDGREREMFLSGSRRLTDWPESGRSIT